MSLTYTHRVKFKPKKLYPNLKLIRSIFPIGRAYNPSIKMWCGLILHFSYFCKSFHSFHGSLFGGILMQEQASWDEKKALILLCFMNYLVSSPYVEWYCVGHVVLGMSRVWATPKGWWTHKKSISCCSFLIHWT